MQTISLKLVTIVSESVLTEQLVEAIKRLGATGYTLTEATGEGSRGMRFGEHPGENVRIETLVGPDVADRILDLLTADFFPNYAVAAWVVDVQVVRGGKYR
jgi:hypothetical protein